MMMRPDIAAAVEQTVDIGMSVLRGNSHGAFLEEGAGAILPSYSTLDPNGRRSEALVKRTSAPTDKG